MSILRRLPDSRFSEVVVEWLGATAAILGGGPSLTLDQFHRIGALHRGSGWLRVIAVNDAYLLAPWADVCYFADSEWWAWQTKGVPKPVLGLNADQVRAQFAAFTGQKCSIQNSGANIKDDAVHILRNKHFPNYGDGISLDPGALATGRNSGFQAINLAILAGAKKILLLGFDGKRGANGEAHWFGDHPRITPVDVFYEAMRKAFSAAEREIAAAGVCVLNCSPGSAIDSFPKMTLEQALA